MGGPLSRVVFGIGSGHLWKLCVTAVDACVSRFRPRALVEGSPELSTPTRVTSVSCYMEKCVWGGQGSRAVQRPPVSLVALCRAFLSPDMTGQAPWSSALPAARTACGSGHPPSQESPVPCAAVLGAWLGAGMHPPWVPSMGTLGVRSGPAVQCAALRAMPLLGELASSAVKACGGLGLGLFPVGRWGGPQAGCPL